jgi:hypothetical protein
MKKKSPRGRALRGPPSAEGPFTEGPSAASRRLAAGGRVSGTDVSPRPLGVCLWQTPGGPNRRGPLSKKKARWRAGCSATRLLVLFLLDLEGPPAICFPNRGGPQPRGSLRAAQPSGGNPPSWAICCADLPLRPPPRCASGASQEGGCSFGTPASLGPAQAGPRRGQGRSTCRAIFAL